MGPHSRTEGMTLCPFIRRTWIKSWTLGWELEAGEVIAQNLLEP